METGEDRVVVLASASPRRRELLRSAGVRFSVNSQAIDEAIQIDELPADAALRLALEKANACAQSSPDAFVLGADTIVVVDAPGEILGKPENAAQAEAMLGRLSGKTHTVLTAFALVCRSRGITEQRCIATAVEFRDLQPEEIRAYIATGEPLDKAGAYGAQGRGAALIRAIHGSYTNVVGLPLAEVLELLSKYDLWRAADLAGAKP